MPAREGAKRAINACRTRGFFTPDGKARFIARGCPRLATSNQMHFASLQQRAACVTQWQTMGTRSGGLEPAAWTTRWERSST